MPEARAVVFSAPHRLELRQLELVPPRDEDEVLVAVEWTGISTGTESLLFHGRMPPFPGLAYPLVPGYEAVGRIVEAGPRCDLAVGTSVFVPGSTCFEGVRCLFGGAGSLLRVAASRVVPLPEGLGERGVLLALAATARHALRGGDGVPPDVVVGHGVLGRLIARQAVAAGGSPVVWEKDPSRRHGGVGYRVIAPEDDPRADYARIYDASGDASILDALIRRLAKGGEITLAGFYAERLGLDFPAAFLKEARLRVAAEWSNRDLLDVASLVANGELDLGELVTHRRDAAAAADAYQIAFEEPECLKMIVDWRDSA